MARRLLEAQTQFPKHPQYRRSLRYDDTFADTRKVHGTGVPLFGEGETRVDKVTPTFEKPLPRPPILRGEVLPWRSK